MSSLRCELQVTPGRSKQETGGGGRLWLLWWGSPAAAPQSLLTPPTQWLSVCCLPEVLLHGVQCQQKRCCAKEVVQLQNFAPELTSLGQDRICAFLNSLGLIANHFFKHLKKHESVYPCTFGNTWYLPLHYVGSLASLGDFSCES